VGVVWEHSMHTGVYYKDLYVSRALQTMTITTQVTPNLPVDSRVHPHQR